MIGRLKYNYHVTKTISNQYNNPLLIIPSTFGLILNLNVIISLNPSQISYNNSTYTEGPQIAEVFNNFFHSVFAKPATSYPDTALPRDISNSILHASNLSLDREQVNKALKRVNIDKGPGSDNIPPILISRCADALTTPILILFNRSLREGRFPDKWKEAHIVPIFKKGVKTKAENYRPISILNIFAKLLEKFVFDIIYPIIYNAIPNNQHGFVRARSTVSNLAQFLTYTLKNMDAGGQVDVIYTDFEKAFDRVDHIILLRKLNHLGIHGDLLRWIESYLKNRSQAVVIGGHKSNFIKICSGVPQGSHLGPLLYNAYLFDIYTCFKNSSHLLYADDKKIFLKIKHDSDCVNLQEDLNRLTSYYANNRITVNTNKCQIITFTRKASPIIFNYKINNSLLQRIDVVKDLGILLDTKLTFNDHIDYITNKAYKNLGFVKRSCENFDNILCIKLLYFSYVRSTLEYGSCVWSPIYQTHKLKIEAIQKKFLKYLDFKSKQYLHTYEKRCDHYRLLSLSDRRILLDQCLLHDIINGRLDTPELLSQISFSTPTKRTRHTKLFSTNLCRTRYAKNLTINRICDQYNINFSNIDIFHLSKNTFKTHIIKLLALAYQ